MYYITLQFCCMTSLCFFFANAHFADLDNSPAVVGQVPAILVSTTHADLLWSIHECMVICGKIHIKVRTVCIKLWGVVS